MDILINQKKEVAKASKRFFSGTLWSRCLGLIRDVMMAYFFGSSSALAALMVAFRLSNLLRRLFGEGALHAAFVPAYERIRLKSQEMAASFFRDLSILLGGGLFLFLLITESFLFYLLHKGHLSLENVQVLSLTMLLLPSLFFICHSAFCSSFLQCQKVYFLPAFSPTFFNLFWIGGIYYSHTLPINQAVSRLALFILLGMIFQWGLLFPKTLSYLRKDLQTPLHFSNMCKSLKKLGKPLLLGVLGVSTTQLNNALDTFFARIVHLEGPAYLWYAIRIEQVPLAIFGVALAGALLPTLSRAFHQNLHSFQELLDFSCSRALGFLIPCTSALFFLGPSILSLLYVRGRFDLYSAIQTTYCLWGYGLGLTFQGLSLILASAFYAQGNYKVTTSATFFSMLLNVFLNMLFAFVFKWGSLGIALATSLSAGFQTLFLFTFLRKNLPQLKWPQVSKNILKIILISFSSGWLLRKTLSYFPSFLNQSLLFFPGSFWVQTLNFALQTSFFLFFLLSLALLFRVKPLLALLEFLPGFKNRV